MPARRSTKRCQIVAAFEHRNNATTGLLFGRLHQFVGYPHKIVLDETQIGQRIGFVCIETC